MQSKRSQEDRKGVEEAKAGAKISTTKRREEKRGKESTKREKRRREKGITFSRFNRPSVSQMNHKSQIDRSITNHKLTDRSQITKARSTQQTKNNKGMT